MMTGSKLLHSVFTVFLFFVCSQSIASGHTNKTEKSTVKEKTTGTDEIPADPKKGKYWVDCNDPDIGMLGLEYMCANRDKNNSN